MRRNYLVIDFECLRPNEWQSVGIVLYGQGGVIRQFQAACDRPCTGMSPSTRSFWKNNQPAFVYNIEQGKTRKVEDEEDLICRFITSLKRDYPHFHLLSDAPEYDIGIMNDILIRHGQTVMSCRSPTTYFQSICTWSSKRTLEMLGVSIQDEDLVGMKQLIQSGLLRHTPIFDCMRILNEYLCLLQTLDSAKVSCRPVLRPPLSLLLSDQVASSWPVSRNVLHPAQVSS